MSFDVASVVDGDFEWDETKATANLLKHGVSFSEAATVFADPYAVELRDLSHDNRFVLIGMSSAVSILFVVHAEALSGRTRLISARRANRDQRRRYEQRG
ncbi:MAG: BrnT family toxin [Myxococcales bacterium]|jgi:uncharacterized DUF497 family protein